MSLVGFDDMPFAELLDPPLTTIRQPVDELGRLASERCSRCSTTQPPPTLTRLPVELMVRRSVAP